MTQEEVEKKAMEIVENLIQFEGWRDLLHVNDFPYLKANIISALLQTRKEAIENFIKIVKSEPELPGDMPDEMWVALCGDRYAIQQALQIAVKQTKENILRGLINEPK